MRYGRDAVLGLDGGGYGHRTGAMAFLDTDEGVGRRLAIDDLRPVGRDVDVGGIELAEPVNGLVYLVDAVAFGRRQHLE